MAIRRVRDRGNAIRTYLTGLPVDRARMVQEIRKTILTNLPSGYAEEFTNGVIRYVIPLSAYPHTYNGQPLLLAALASQKSFVTLYLMAIYGDRKLEKWFREAYAHSGRRLDMGKSCVHFKRIEDIPHRVIGQAIARVTVKEFIKLYEAARQHRRPR